MANVTRNNNEWDVDVVPGENLSLATANTYVDGDINVHAVKVIKSKLFDDVWAAPLDKTTTEAKAINSHNSNTQDGTTWAGQFYIYLGKIRNLGIDKTNTTTAGRTWDAPWHIKMRVVAQMFYRDTNGNKIYHNDGKAIYEWDLYGSGTSYTYSNFNTRYNWTPIYYSFINRPQASYMRSLNDSPVLWGINFNSTNSTYSNRSYYKREILVEIVEQDGCDMEFLDDWQSIRNYHMSNSAIFPTGSATNYLGYLTNSGSTLNVYDNGFTNFDVVNNGLRESGDDNTTDRVNLHNAYLKISPYTSLPAQGFFGLDRDSRIMAISEVYNGSSALINTTGVYALGTGKAANVRVYNSGGFDWRRGLFLDGSWSLQNVNSDYNSTPSSAAAGVDFRYTDNCVADTSTSTNCTLGMLPRKPVYIRGVIKEDGLFYLAPISVTYNNNTYPRVWTQAVPTSVEYDAAGYQYMYWLFGYPYYNGSYPLNCYQIDLLENNPMFWFHNNQFVEYTGFENKLDKTEGGRVTGELYSDSLTADSLLVNGDARFVNQIHGTIDNASKLNNQDPSYYLNYNNLSNKPSIPSAANNGTLTIQKNGTQVATFGANSSSNVTANITVPTQASDIGAMASTVTHLSGDVPTTRKVNNKALSADITLTASDVGATTEKYVDDAIAALPEPMIFKGSLGTGGTITSLPAAATSNEGFTYKVITAGTYASQSAKVGDTFISDGTTWVLIPSGDEPSGTVTSVGMTVPTGLSVSGSPITSSGTLAVSYANGYSIPTTTKQSAWDAKYDKPSGGIPKTDLASAVQTSLGKADTALQSHQDISGKLDKSGGTMTGALKVSTAAMPLAGGKISGMTTGTSELYKDGLAISNPATANDAGWVRVTGTDESDTVLEIATGDDGGSGEKIVFRGYNTSNNVAYQVDVPKKTGTMALTSDIGNGTLTLQKNGNNVATFTANQSGATTANFVINPEDINEGYLDKRVYLNTHPEANGVVIPFINNDIAFLKTRGGNCTVYTTTSTDYTQQTLDIKKAYTSADVNTDYWFDGSSSYGGFKVDTVSEVMIIDIDMPEVYSYSTCWYIDFGAGSWRAKDIALYAYHNNTENYEKVYRKLGSCENKTNGHWYLSTSYIWYKDAEKTIAGGYGANKIRFVLTNWNNVNPRIAQIGLIYYGSSQQRMTTMSRGLDDMVYRNITPYSDNIYSLGSATRRWKLNGTTVPANPKFTDTTYSAGTGLSLSGTTFSADGSAIINSLTEGGSSATRNDYIVAQYAGGGTTTTTYHRRKLSNIFAALNKTDITTALGYTPLQSYTETDPVFAASAAAGITSANITTWNGKQNALATQTAYSAKGSATKVPQITTNSLGQVTGITEVTITDNDTKNTTGSTDTSSKIFLVGATSQAANPQTYSHDTVYVDTDGVLNSPGLRIPTAGSIDWTSDSYRQRISVLDDAIANTNVFTFQQSSDGGRNYQDLATIKDNGDVIAMKSVQVSNGKVSLDYDDTNKCLKFNFA